MSKLFGNMNKDGHEESRDVLGGYSVLDSNIYTGIIKQFYAGEAASGAKNITVILSGGDFGDTEYRETIYITNKKGENFFTKNDKKSSLPGFTTIDDICLCAGGEGLSETDFEEKTVKIYDYEAKKELPKSVMVATGLIGKEVSVAILKNLENQTEKVNGEYVAKEDGSTRETNAIDKVFNTEHRLTVHEARHGSESAFWDKWLEKNKGQTRDRTEKPDGKSGKPGGAAPQSGGGNAGDSSPRKSLFGK